MSRFSCGIEQGNWLQNCQKLEEDFRHVIGPVAAIEKFFATPLAKSGCREFIIVDEVLDSKFMPQIPHSQIPINSR